MMTPPPQILTHYLLEVADRRGQHCYSHALSTVATALKLISAMVSRGSLILSPESFTNPGVTEELNEARRLKSTRIVLEQAAACGEIAAVSFSDESIIYQVTQGAPYLLSIDVMHHTITLAENQPIGIAFSITERKSVTETVTDADFLRAGTEQLSAGFALFGPVSVLILTTGEGVDGFTLDQSVGDYVLTSPSITIPEDSDVLAVDLSHAQSWSPPLRRYVDERIRSSQAQGGRRCTMRWNNSAILGAFRVLMNGGLFMLPESDQGGLIPLLHTAQPLSMLIEQAGGQSTDGANRIATICPKSLTHRVPIVFGTPDDIQTIEAYSSDHDTSDEPEGNYPLFHNRTIYIRSD